MTTKSQRVALQIFVAIAVVANLVAILRVAYFSPLDHDEIEHAHVAWLLAQGLLPYRDFHQIHFPLVWALVSPFIDAFPSPLALMRVLRLVCLGMTALAFAAGIQIIRDCVPRERRMTGLLFALFFSSFVVITEAYRFRPDPFMAAGVMVAIAALCRTGASLGRRLFWSGLALSLAATFSPKMAPLLLLPFVAIGVELAKGGVVRLGDLVRLAAGAALGAVPFLAFIAYYGVAREFSLWVLELNAGAVNLVDAGGLITTLGLWTASILWLGRGIITAAKAMAIVGAASILGLAVPILNPNHYDYNYLVAVAPAALTAAAIAAASIAGVAKLGVRHWAAIALIGACLLARPLYVEGVRLNVKGAGVSWQSFAVATRCLPAEGAVCAGVAPNHPVYCRDAAPAHLGWDLSAVHLPWLPEPAKAAFRQLWVGGVARIVAARPAIVMGSSRWFAAAESGLITYGEAQALQQFLEGNYVRYPLDDLFVRTDLASCLSSTP